jgi:hypothetical protein
MPELLNYIEANNNHFINEITKLVLNDEYAQELVGFNQGNSTLIKKDAIHTFISTPNNIKSIDTLLRYIISEYLYDNDQVCLIRLYVSADTYTKTCGLYVYQCKDIYFCYFLDDEIKSIITNNPTDFCYECVRDIKATYESEKENEGYFESFELTLVSNFDFEKA